MSYGLNVYNASGSLIFSSADMTWLQVDHFQVGANSTVTKSYPVVSGFTLTVQLQPINTPPASTEGWSPEVIISGTTITVRPYSGKSSEAVNVLVLARG